MPIAAADDPISLGGQSPARPSTGPSARAAGECLRALAGTAIGATTPEPA